MKRETKTVWISESGSELLTQRGTDFYIPLSTVNADTLRELGKAIADALSDELVQAMNHAKERGKSP